MKLADLEMLSGRPIEDESEESCDPEEQILIDIRAAIDLFSKIKTLLDYTGNKELVKTLSNLERTVMFNVSEEIRLFLAEVEPTYSEEAA